MMAFAQGEKRCKHPGCTEPRYRSYTRCVTHQRQYWVEHHSKYYQRKSPPVRVIAINYAAEKLQYLEAKVVAEQPIPYFESDLLRVLAQAAREGYIAAKPIPYKESDFK